MSFLIRTLVSNYELNFTLHIIPPIFDSSSTNIIHVRHLGTFVCFALCSSNIRKALNWCTHFSDFYLKCSDCFHIIKCYAYITFYLVHF